MKKVLTFLLVFNITVASFSQTQTNYDLSAANGNGFRFWNGNDNYKIHMGNSTEYKYGPVTDYSIKTNMVNGVPGRGWTWGGNGQVPIAALNSVGDFQVAKNFFAMGKLGIGTTSPNAIAHVVSQNGQTENLARFQVADSPIDYFQINNATSVPGQFIPTLQGYHVTDNRSTLYVMGQTSDVNDNGSNALLVFDARRSTGPIQTRPLFTWTSYTTKMMTMLANGNLGIGTTSPDAKLTVKGKIHTEEVKVDLSVPGPDYVFKEDYNLKSLEEVHNYIQQNGHLPNIPSAEEMEANGIQLGEMNMRLLEKIEELTLYTIKQEKKIIEFEKKLNQLLENNK